MPISAVSTSSHSEQSSQARQSRWYCRNRWESRSVPFFTRKPLLETVKGFFRLDTSVFPCTGYGKSSAYRLSQHRTVGEPAPSEAVPQLSFTSLVKRYCFSAVSYSCISINLAVATCHNELYMLSDCPEVYR